MDGGIFSLAIAHPGQFHVYHLRRSGGHGVIDWLLGHHSGNRIHYNQAFPVKPGWIKAPRGQTCEMPGDWGQPLFELVSFEDVGLERLSGEMTPPRQAILLLRDPFNMVASRLRMVRADQAGKSLGAAGLNRIDPALWKQYAREFLDPHYLPHAIRLNFNRWYVSPDYRRQIAERLGWTFTDRGFGSSSGWKFSHGSSFGDRDPKNLSLFDRWEFYRDDPEFLGYFDEEMRELSREIFDFAPPLRVRGTRSSVGNRQKVPTG